jgi:hypothetical protein
MNVNENGGGVPTVENTPQPAPAPPGGPAAPPTPGTNPKKGTTTSKPAAGETKGGLPQPPKSDGQATVTPPASGEVTTPPVEPGLEPPVNDGTQVVTDPNETALSLDDVQRKLGLRGAQSVSRAFGAFLGLGLILPLARFVIRRLG